VVDELLMRGNTASGVWADSAYRSADIEKTLKARGLTSRIHRKGNRGKPLTEQALKSNKTKSSVRVRVEHVFGAQSNDMGGTLVRTIGLLRAKAKIGMKNLAYNIRRSGQLRRLNPCPA
jgi:IS5 family transposase